MLVLHEPPSSFRGMSNSIESFSLGYVFQSVDDVLLMSCYVVFALNWCDLLVFLRNGITDHRVVFPTIAMMTIMMMMMLMMIIKEANNNRKAPPGQEVDNNQTRYGGC